MGATALPSGLVQLGSLSIVAPTDADRLELALTRGELGKQWLVPATITLESNVLASNGGYQHNALWQGSYHLNVQHESTEEPTNMVTMSDAYAALQMAAGHNPNESEAPLQPWQFLAADINRDGKVRASDALTILKMALNYHDAPSEEWIFLPEWVGKSEMTRSSVDWSAAEIMLDVENYQIVNLIGVIQGDVDGSFS